MTKVYAPTATAPSGVTHAETPEQAQLREMATLLSDTLEPFAVAMATHIHEQVPALGGVGDRDALEATRVSCESNLSEIFSMIRAGLSEEAIDTPPPALEYARFLRSRGVGYEAVITAYQYGVAMFRDVLGLELGRRVSNPDVLRRALEAGDAFLSAYIGTTLQRIRMEYDSAVPAWQPAATDAVLANKASMKAAETFRSVQLEHGRWIAERPELSGARARSERTLSAFTEAIRDAATDPELSRRLSLAETTVAFVLADEPELAVTLLLDGTPIEAVDGVIGAPEITLWIASFDLAQLISGQLKLPMAIARERVIAEGPVRKFLRVLPVLAAFGERQHRRDGSAAPTAHQGRIEEFLLDEENEDSDETGFSAAQRDLLEGASEFQHHTGAMAVTERNPGDFWSVECIDVYKSFGRNRVLNGLNLGIPEGMISVILGPSGTGKSVLINHLIGLMFPDSGEILVHGKSVPNRRRSELFEMRREFGILFQDGALFGSLNVYDNVAFPLREQTNKSEEEIRQIVEQRLEEVGLSDAATRTPNEISGGMKKRAGFARALVLEPKIVMFDEPDSGLDPVRTALLCDLIRKVHGEHGGTYIVITHDIASARRLGDYIAVLWKGRIVESGDAESMFNSENPFVRQFLGGSSVGPLGME